MASSPPKPVNFEAASQYRANRYKIMHKLGRGVYGTAYLVLDERCPEAELRHNKYKALKQIEVSGIDPEQTMDAVREGRLLAKLNHPNIVKFFANFLQHCWYCIVTEYCEGGDLDQVIQAYRNPQSAGGGAGGGAATGNSSSGSSSSNSNSSPPQHIKKTISTSSSTSASTSSTTGCSNSSRIPHTLILRWIIQLLRALHHMHCRNILHRDLTTRNIFLKHNSVKLGDFGISRLVNSSTDLATTFVGTPYYMSPEVLQHDGYNSKSDVWSAGVVLYELCELEHAFEGPGLMAVMYKIVEGPAPCIGHKPSSPYPPANAATAASSITSSASSSASAASSCTPLEFSRHVQWMINAILNKDVQQRPSARECLNWPFLLENVQLADIDVEADACDAASMLIDPSETLIRRDAAVIRDSVQKSAKLGQLTDLKMSPGPDVPPSGFNFVGELNSPVSPSASDNLNPREKLALKKQIENEMKASELISATQQNYLENQKCANISKEKSMISNLGHNTSRNPARNKLVRLRSREIEQDNGSAGDAERTSPSYSGATLRHQPAQQHNSHSHHQQAPWQQNTTVRASDSAGSSNSSASSDKLSRTPLEKSFTNTSPQHRSSGQFAAINPDDERPIRPMKSNFYQLDDSVSDMKEEFLSDPRLAEQYYDQFDNDFIEEDELESHRLPPQTHATHEDYAMFERRLINMGVGTAPAVSSATPTSSAGETARANSSFRKNFMPSANSAHQQPSKKISNNSDTSINSRKNSDAASTLEDNLDTCPYGPTAKKNKIESMKRSCLGYMQETELNMAMEFLRTKRMRLDRGETFLLSSSEMDVLVDICKSKQAAMLVEQLYFFIN